MGRCSVCNLPLFREVCLNYEVVVFQPQTGTPPHLGYVVINTNFKSSPPVAPASTIFLYHYFPSSVLLSPHHHLYIVVSLSLCVSPATHLLSRHQSPPTWTSPAPATRKTLPLVSAPRSARMHLPLFPVTVSPPPFPTLGLLPGPCWPLGGLSVTGSLRLPCAFNLSYLNAPLFFGWIFAQRRDSRFPPLPDSHSP